MSIDNPEKMNSRESIPIVDITLILLMLPLLGMVITLRVFYELVKRIYNGVTT